MRALVLGASGGIGGALAGALRGRGAHVTPLSRSRDGLDVTDQQAVARAAGRLSGPFDTIINATGALVIDGHAPEKTLRAVEADALAAQFALNATGAALCYRYFAPLLPRGTRSVFATLSARVGSIGDNGLGGWIGYRAAKAAQNQITRTAAIEIARTHPHAIVLALHPGTVATPLTARYAARHPTITPARAAEALLAVMDARSPADTGTFYDWKNTPVPW